MTTEAEKEARWMRLRIEGFFRPQLISDIGGHLGSDEGKDQLDSLERMMKFIKEKDSHD